MKSVSTFQVKVSCVPELVCCPLTLAENTEVMRMVVREIQLEVQTLIIPFPCLGPWMS